MRFAWTRWCLLVLQRLGTACYTLDRQRRRNAARVHYLWYGVARAAEHAEVTSLCSAFVCVVMLNAIATPPHLTPTSAYSSSFSLMAQVSLLGGIPLGVSEAETAGLSEAFTFPSLGAWIGFQAHHVYNFLSLVSGFAGCMFDCWFHHTSHPLPVAELPSRRQQGFHQEDSRV